MTEVVWSVKVVSGPDGNDDDSRVYRSIREQVFVVGQSCPPEEEWDAHETDSRHLLGVVNGEAVATARWRVVDWQGTLTAKLERFAVLESAQGRGVGRRMITATIEDARAAGHERFLLHAQAHLEELYASFDFRRVGDLFDEAGIPHVLMVRT